MQLLVCVCCFLTANICFGLHDDIFFITCLWFYNLLSMPFIDYFCVISVVCQRESMPCQVPLLHLTLGYRLSLDLELCLT